MSSQKRRLWEFYGPLICRLLGLAFDEDQLNKVVKKLKTKDGEPTLKLSEEHGVLVATCAKQNELSKYVEKILERQFEPYRKLVEGVDQEQICQSIEGQREVNGLKDIPLPALIWFAVRNQHEDIEKIEFRVFNALHMQEHQSLRFYDALSRELPDGKVENVLGELKRALKSRAELQKRYERSEQKREKLKMEMEATKQEKSGLALALAEQKQLNEKSKEALEKLGGQSALDLIESLKKEKELLDTQIKTLTEELLNWELYQSADIVDQPTIPEKDYVQAESVARDNISDEQELFVSLQGMKVAFVGGFKSLAPHYRHVVEGLGGVFCDYRDDCQGRKEAENLASSADIVFCPIDMNSHRCCHCIKRVCKVTGKPCCFLRNSSLNAFRRELIEFARSLN
jgi:hypothetical protein